MFRWKNGFNYCRSGRHHHGCAKRLNKPAEKKYWVTWGQITTQGTQGEDRHSGQINIATAQSVGELAPKHQGNRYGQEVKGYNELSVFEAEVKRAHDCRQSNVDHAAVHG